MLSFCALGTGERTARYFTAAPQGEQRPMGEGVLSCLR